MKKEVTFITGNENKAKYLEELLGLSIGYEKVDIEEIQSLDLEEVVRHKVREAFAAVKKPVLVEDVSLTFNALGKLPGTFIKWFEGELSYDELCRLVDGKGREAVACCMFAYFDGAKEVYFKGEIKGSVSETPRGTGGYGWDVIFIPEGYSKTRAELTKDEYDEVYKALRPFDKVRDFLQVND